MKKIILFVISILMIISVFAGCSQNSDDAKSTSQSNTSVNENLVTTRIAETPVEDAEITSAEASEIISKMPLEKLNLEGEKDDYKFMVSTEGKTIDGTDYIEVIASQVKEEKEDGSINMETKGNYFVSYDGKTILIRDITTGAFSELK